MILHLPNTKENNIICFDIEYDRSNLIQMAALLLQRQDDGLFRLTQSFNIYVKPPYQVNNFFTKYTGITTTFLYNNGQPLEEAQQIIKQFIGQTEAADTLLVSHGVEGDLNILNLNGICFDANQPTYCTYKRAKKLLKRKKHLTLAEVAAEDGFVMFNEHNAYADVWGTLHALCLLKQKEGENLCTQ